MFVLALLQDQDNNHYKQPKMFCILPCPTVKDNVQLVPIGQTAKIIPQMEKTRSQIRRLSDTEILIKSIQNGELIMTKKVAFDNYLASQVDLMRSYVGTLTACNFVYNCFFTPEKQIVTTGMSIKQQWAFEIVMSRFNISSIYHAGAIQAMGVIFKETTNSYKPGYKNMSDLTKNLQEAFHYFSEGYEPLKRMLNVFPHLELLFSNQNKQKFLETNKGMLEIFVGIVECNLAYLKLQKFRVLGEFKSCKEGAQAVYLRVADMKMKLKALKGKFSITQDIFDFLDLTQIFYQIYAFYYLLLQNEDNKIKNEMGFIQKQFQLMIMDNLVVIDEILKLNQKLNKFPNGDSLDNVIFARMIVGVMIEEVNKLKYRFSINIHENKSDYPSIGEVVARRIGVRNIWASLNQF